MTSSKLVQRRKTYFTGLEPKFIMGERLESINSNITGSIFSTAYCVRLVDNGESVRLVNQLLQKLAKARPWAVFGAAFGRFAAVFGAAFGRFGAAFGRFWCGLQPLKLLSDFPLSTFGKVVPFVNFRKSCSLCQLSGKLFGKVVFKRWP